MKRLLFCVILSEERGRGGSRRPHNTRNAMQTERPLILISNDDGIAARGILTLADIASDFGDVTVVAPDTPQSGKSSALTVNEALRITQHPARGAVQMYSVNGTPVDCVKLGMHAVVPRRPALLLSGINHGSNAAVNNIYSGTMGAAMEGCIYGIASIGFSLLDHSPAADFGPVEGMVADIIGRTLACGLPAGICLNVNFPAVAAVRGLKAVRAAKGYWTEEYASYASPSGHTFYMLAGRFHNFEPDNPETDEYWLARGYATAVAIRPDQSVAPSGPDGSAAITALTPLPE